MEKKEIAELFMKGIDCSQVVVGAFAEELGITTEEAYKMSAESQCCWSVRRGVHRQ